MTVPEGIVERKDLKVICAPPWGTNYEMKAKKNTKQLSYFYDEKEKNAAEGCESSSCPGRNEIDHEAMPPAQGDSEHFKEIQQTEQSGGSGSTNIKQIDGGGDVDSINLAADPNPHIPRCAEQNKMVGSQSVRDVTKSKTVYETSNSAYGLHRPFEPEANLPKSYRRVSSFSKLYGDKQPLKK